MNVSNRLLASCIKNISLEGALLRGTLTVHKTTGCNVLSTSSGPSEHLAAGTVESEQQQKVDQENDSQEKCDPRMTSQEGSDSLIKKKPVAPDPETCCEGGCVNCVWIKYANEVNEFYPQEEKAAKLKEILNNVEDYNVKMFLKLELGL